MTDFEIEEALEAWRKTLSQLLLTLKHNSDDGIVEMTQELKQFLEEAIELKVVGIFEALKGSIESEVKRILTTALEQKPSTSPSGAALPEETLHRFLGFAVTGEYDRDTIQRLRQAFDAFVPENE